MRNYLVKALTLVLCLCLILCQIPNAFAADDTVYISSLEAFLDFAESCRLDSYSMGKKFCLTTDIDLSSTDFDGIAVFCGTFDGSWHTISGLRIDSAGSVKGLFRYLQETAVVKNLAVKGDVVPTGSKSDVGGIAGSNAGTIVNCSFSGQVIGSDNVGGIVGNNLIGAVINGCTSMGTVSGKHFSGGIVGSNAGLVQNCTNRSNVNSTAQQNSIDISDVTMGSLLNTESAAAATDIGGIVGYSEGMILSCKNYGTIGYQHMGYNVGGIVGLQRGYVNACENYGSIFGRKEVGGIIGQQEPEIVLRYSTDTLQILEQQIGSLSGLIHIAADNAGNNTAAVKNIIRRMEKDMQALEKAVDILQTGAQTPKLEDLQTYLDALKTIRSSLSSLRTALGELWDAVDTTATDLERDMQAISDQVSVIESTLNHAEDNLGGNVTDISDADTDADLTSKVENCNNYGAVCGDLHVGGIVGIVAFENDLDPEEDIAVEGDATLNAAGNFRSVIRTCRNFSTVTAKTMRVGGIVGWLSMGLVHSCVNSGHLQNPSADHVGGIAGESAGFVRSCMVRSILSGDMYVGGICGSGSIASDCLAMVSITGTERTGAVMGFANQPYSEAQDPIIANYYLLYGKDPGAVDSVSYAGQAEGLPKEDFLLKADLFSKVTITFEANGEVVLQAELPTGSAFTQIPDVPHLPGTTGVWDGIDQIDFDCVLFDVTVHASYILNGSVLQSDYLDANSKPVLLLQGDFSNLATVHVTPMENCAVLQEGQTLIQAWNFTTEQCVSLQAGRLLIPEGADTENMILLVRDRLGKWSQRTYRISDSYIVFSLADGDDGVALVQVPSESILTTNMLIAAGVGGLAVLLLVALVIAIKRSWRKRKSAAATTQ